MRVTTAGPRKLWNIAVGLGLALSATAGLAEPLRLVADLDHGRSELSTDWTDLRQLTAVGDRVVFVAQEPGSGTELWVSDGTMLGTKLLRDLEPGSASPEELQILGSDGEVAFLYFKSASAPDAGLWRTYGTSAGTFPLGFGSSWFDFLPGYRPQAVMRGST